MGDIKVGFDLTHLFKKTTGRVPGDSLQVYHPDSKPLSEQTFD